MNPEDRPADPTQPADQSPDPNTVGDAAGTQAAEQAPADAEPTGVDAGDEAAPAVDRVAELEGALAERTDDLKRLQAEYVNYKKRVDRDREVSRRAGAEKVMVDLLGVLDNIGSAREHEEMSDGFKAVASTVERLAQSNGLVAFGEQGDVFDPQVHEAMMQTEQAGITEPTAVQILQVGYRLGDRVLRPARVVVAQPAAEQPEAPDQEV